MGFWKVRLTGGEPTVRRDILEIAKSVSATPGISHVCLSTNGYRLFDLAEGLKSAGVSTVNVSVDSLDSERFRKITGHDRLEAVLFGIKRCLKLGFETKINVVLLKGLNEDEFERFLELPRKWPLAVRFIELMPTGENSNFFSRYHLTAQGLVRLLEEKGWTEAPRRQGDGPARLFCHTGYRGRVGIIAPYSKNFCSTCNRLRVTSRGGLRLCLFAEGDFPLRPLLQENSQKEDLIAAIRALLSRKEPSHYLPEGRLGNVRHFAMIGG
jgi:cyclic pyranopterin phosphate synthase